MYTKGRHHTVLLTYQSINVVVTLNRILYIFVFVRGRGKERQLVLVVLGMHSLKRTPNLLHIM